MAEERAGPTSEPLEIIELGRPPLSHITPEGEEVVRPTLTPEQRHLRALAQLPLADLLSEDLDGSPAPAPAAPTASAAAGPPPPEVMHRLAAAHSEAEMVSMLVRAMLAGKQQGGFATVAVLINTIIDGFNSTWININIRIVAVGAAGNKTSWL